jgi:uncharacterized protein involved in exopolysaccharide biosynthesis
MTDDSISARPVPDDDGDLNLSPFSVANFFLRRRRVLLVCLGLGVAFGLGWALTTSRIYQAEVLFVTTPGVTRAAGGLMSDLGPIQQRDPIDYYISVLGSSAVTASVLQAKATDGRTLRERLGLAADASAHDVRTLLNRTQVQLVPSARARSALAVPVLTIKAGWTDADTAADLANAYYDALAKYDHEIRTTAARDRSVFIQKQVTETDTRLRDAEAALRIFKERNRLLTAPAPSSPDQRATVPPKLEEMRSQLQRNVDVQSELYLSLKKALDQASLAERDDASAMVLVERAFPPRVPSGGGRRQIVWFGMALGLLTGLGLAVLLELRHRADFSSRDGQEFVGHLNDIHRQMRDVLTRGARVLSPPADPPESHQK